RQDWGIVVIFEGNSDAVAWQQEQLRGEARTSGFDAPDVSEQSRGGSGISPVQSFKLSSGFVFRANLRPSQAPAFCTRGFAWTNVELRGIAAGAVVRGHFTDNDVTL